MNQADSQPPEDTSLVRAKAIQPNMGQIERHQWWLWSYAAMVTLLLTIAVVSLSVPVLLKEGDNFFRFNLDQAVRGLVGMVLLFDIYTAYQQLQIHRIRRQLTEREELFRLISENAADMIALVDTDGRRLYNSPAYQRVLGYSPEELSTTLAFEQIHPDDRQRVIEAAEEACRTGVGRSLEYRIRHKDGAWRILESTASVISNAKGESEKLVIVNRDITDRKGAEEALRASEQRHRELFENATCGICLFTVDGRFLGVNPALVSMLGYESAAELLIRNLATDVYRDPAEYARLIARYGRLGRLEGTEVEWKRKDGKPIMVRLSGRALRSQEAQFQIFEGIVEDVTERRALEKQLREAQKFEAIGQLAGGIAHDFNNVIAAVMGWADLGLQEAPQDSKLCSRFQKIRHQADRAAGLTRQLLAFARRQVLQPRNVSLNDRVADVISLLEKVIGEQIEVKTVLAPDLQGVRADPTHIEQVLMNLCVNARDAMPEGGRLLIETGNVEVDEEYCRHHVYARPGRYVLLSVSDTGVGMDAATMERIFEPFFTTKEVDKGTGLGLSVVYGIVKQHGGFIKVYSEPGRGATFRVYLPVACEVTEEQQEVATKPVRGGADTILVAEDHEGLREIARETLEKLGYQVLLASDGEEAVRIFEGHQDRIDLVLLDVVLPKLKGPEAYGRMCAVKPDVAVIFATGYAAEATQLNSMFENGMALLQKPYTTDKLARKVRDTLDHARQYCH